MKTPRVSNVHLLLLLSLLLSSASVAQPQRKFPYRLTGEVKPPASKPSPAIVVGSNVQVSRALGDRAHNETHLAANPRNPLNLIGGSMVWLEETNTHTVVAYASFDGGKSWSPTLRFDDEFFHSDPAVGFDAEGTAYFLQITNTRGREPKYYTHLYRSKDGGRSWLEPTILPMLDRHYVVVDDNAGKYQGSLYVSGISARAVWLRKSEDRGANFDDLRQVVSASSDRTNAGLAPPAVLSDGTLAIAFADTDRVLDRELEGRPSKHNAALKIVTSVDGGITFSEPATIAPTSIGHMITSNAHHFSLAADRSSGPFKDRLYVTWADSYSRGGQFSAKKSGGSNILCSYSTDKGKTWSKPILLNDDRTPINWVEAPVHFQPVVAVNKDGVVGVMYYDRRDSANNLDWTVRFTASLDGGETFLPSVQVSESPSRFGGTEKLVLGVRGYGGGHMPPNTSYRGGALKFDLGITQFNFGGGHTAGLAPDAKGVFHPFWVDNRTGVSQVWTAPVTVQRKAMNHGDSELAKLQDVSENVILIFANPVYDAKTGRLEVGVQLHNVSDDIILPPVRLRVVGLTSAASGILKIVNADNEMEGVGAVWNMDHALIDRQLKPNQKTSVRRLEFHIADKSALNQATIIARGWGSLELVHLEARALANVERNAQATGN